MQFDFTGQTVLITGSTRGIGQQMASDFNSLGAKLLLTGTNTDQIERLNQEAKELQSSITYYCVDFDDMKSTDEFLEQISQFEKIDVLINNAGINKIDPIEETDPADWDRLMNVNLKAPYLLIRAVAPIMKRNKYGRIVNIASIFSVVSRSKRSIYTATKYGLQGLTVTSSIELSRYGVLVNTVSPGFIDTDLTRRILSDSERKTLEEQIPVGRFATPEEISRVAVFLASPLNTYLAGQNIVVDGAYICV